MHVIRKGMFRLLKSNWGLVCAIVLAAAFLAEWALRLLAPQPLIHTLVRHDPLLGARGVPFGQASIVRPDGGRHTVRLNGMGFRMREELSRSNDRHRILVYGGGAIFSAHLPIHQTVFGLLKNAIEAKTRSVQLVNAAISGHSIQSTRLLMMEQIPDLQPRALVYVFDAGTFARTLVSSDRSAVGELRFDKNGHPILVDPSRSPQFEYFERVLESLDWLHRHSQLTTLIITRAGQLIDWARALLGEDTAEIRLAELPRMAGESADIKETMYLSELHFLRMARIANASTVPLLVAWLPAPQELVAGSESSSMVEILQSYRQMLRRLANGHENFTFWDSVVAARVPPDSNRLFESRGFGAGKLNADGSRWFANLAAPAIIAFLHSATDGTR